MRVYLPDVNVLVALFDPAHPNHDAAHDWFGRTGKLAWASCPITELGLVRVLSHPSYPSVRATASEVASRFGQLCAQPGHRAWPCDVSFRDSGRFALDRLQGPKQLTDVYLLALAVRHRGALATFDRRIPPSAVPRGGAAALALLEA